MFTGIIESLGKVKQLEKEGSNLLITMESEISDQLKIDQSLAHNGVCLTVIQQIGQTHTVAAIQETLDRSNLGDLKVSDFVNLERAMQMNARLDGHMVQGHVDSTARCIDVQTLEGSWYFQFHYPKEQAHLLVDKGSIAVNGVSLTLVEPTPDTFKVAIIPYTYEHTNFNQIKVGDTVNLEFDIIGKYIARSIAIQKM